MPKEIPCARCKKDYVIPTYQFVKIEDEVHYLCDKCWEEFRYWYHRPEKDEKK
jgi:DNA-directed RNA polymerase subunit RPC12/RpoP